MNQIALAFRVFFALIFQGQLPPDMITELGLMKKQAPPPAAPPAPAPARLSDGALQIVGILQRDARILDFFMEDITPYSDEQVGGAAREVHDKTREVLARHFAPVPVIDAVEGSSVSSDGNPASVKFIGNVPATGKPSSGLLRHRGWKATTATLPKLNSANDLVILAPAEIEVE